MEGFKLWSIDRFGEDVCFFIVYVYEFKTHNSFFHQVSNEMVTYLYVLRFWILDRVLRKIYDTDVITENTHCILRNSIVMKQLLHPKKLCAATSSGYVLCFSYRELTWNFVSCSSTRQDCYQGRSSLPKYSFNRPHYQPSLHLNTWQGKHLSFLNTTNHNLEFHWYIV